MVSWPRRLLHLVIWHSSCARFSGGALESMDSSVLSKPSQSP
jgi:hypothetical protein